MSEAPSPAFSMAARPASTESADVVPPTRRSRMPVRSTIQASLVSSRASSCAFVTTVSGRADPQPAIAAPLVTAWAQREARRPAVP